MDEIVEVSITKRNSEGKLIRQRLNGEDARKWNRFCDMVSGMAFVHGMNPKWEELNWEYETITDWS